MTDSAFLGFYPQFAAVPAVVRTAYMELANARFADFEEDAEEARRLYVAHRLTLYAKTWVEAADGGTVSVAQLSSQGESYRVASRRVENVSVTYAATGESSAGSSALEDLNDTVYGKQLASLLKIHRCPAYVP